MMVSMTLDRVPVRTRESAVTRSAWRLAFSGEQGEGSIVLLEVPGGPALYRGEGICLGWSQERLADAYRELRPAGGGREPDPGQLG